MMDYDKAICKLTDRYSQIIDENGFPAGAWKLNGKEIWPAIPFVGKAYFEQPKKERVLVYASAENLTWCNENTASEENYCGTLALLRGRRTFEEQGSGEEALDDFPNIHIQPINDGGLLIVTNRIMRNMFNKAYDENPRSFVERICCANYGKYTIENPDNRKLNMDYARNKELLQLSQPYVKADIEILDPSIVVMPKTMFFSGQKEFLKMIAKGKTIVCVPQINPTNVNCHIFNKKKEEAGVYKTIELSESEMEWLNKLHRFNLDKFISVYEYVDNELFITQL